MEISLAIVARNEAAHLPQLIENIKAQNYPHKFVEIIFINSMSTDETKTIMSDFKNQKGDFKEVKVLDNHEIIQAAGWNMAIYNMSGDVLIRLDAHAMIPNDFIRKNALRIEAGEAVCGGVRPCLIEEETLWKKTLLQVENSLFGSGINISRRGKEKKYVKTVFHAAYRREVFEKAGMFDERLLRTEDNEMHYRIRQAGYKICFDPDIRSYQYARNSFLKMLAQKFNNGYWVGVTLNVCPKCLSIYHFVPFAFIIGISLTTIMAIKGITCFSLFMWSSYCALTIIMTMISVFEIGINRFTLLMPLLYFFLHVSYGIGTLKGIISIPLVNKKWSRQGK